MFRRGGCSQTRDLLSPYLDGRLSRREQQRVEDHLRGCEDCTRELDSLRTTVALLHLTPVVKPPRSFALRGQVVSRQSWQGAAILRWSTALAIGLLLVLVGGEALSSVALKSAPASAPQMAQKSSGYGNIAPMSESTGAASQRAPLTPAATAGDRTEEVGRSDDSTRSVPSAPATPAASASALGTSSGEETRGAGLSGATLQPTAVASQPWLGQQSATGLPILRIVEIGLAALVLALLAAGFLARRAGR